MESIMCLLWPALFAVFMQVSADSHSSPCNPGLNTPECLAAVKQVMADDNRFWFGTSYSTVCSPFSFSATCNNNDKTHTSIITRVRVNTDNSTDTIKQVLNVTFDVSAGSYQACGNTYQVPAVTQTLDPTQTTNISLWSANYQPHVSWTAEDNKIYTLIVWDAGAIILHGVMYNIRGSNLDNAQTAVNYRGPKNPVDRAQPYVFLLYEQQAEISTNLTSAITAFLSESMFLAPDKIVNFASLTGPVGVSVLSVKADLFSTEYMKQNRIVNNCPVKLTPIFAALPLSYNVSDVQLLSSLDVTFTSPEISFRSCCHDVTIMSNSTMTNPMGNGRIWPVYTRDMPSIVLTPMSFFDPTYYTRNNYTLLLMDVTDDLALTSDPDTIVHWQMVNIRQGDLTSGDTTLPYKAPLPLTGQGDRTLMFLLLQQSMEVNTSDLAKFTGDSCPQHLLHRCRFNLTAFITQLGMKVEGASWFVTSPDLYSRQQAVLENLQPEASACLGVPDYSSPCLDACNPDISTPECLAAVKQVMADDNRFWFGTNYAIACPPFSFSAACTNPYRNHTSIITRVRVNNDNSTDTIKQVLNVTYDAPAGSYQACGNTYQVPAVTQTLDPTQTTNISLWSAQYQPDVSWTAEDNKIYTVIVWSAGAAILHAVMYNIRGSNLDNAQIAFNYRGPVTPELRPQPYVFLLYEQQAEISINLTSAIAAFRSESMYLDADKIVNIASLTGPVGVSVMTVTADLFSTEYMKQSRVRNNCPVKMTPMFAALPLSYDVSDVQLLSSLDITFTSPEISFRSCCHDVTIMSNSTMTNPLGNGRIWPVYTRDMPSIVLTPISFFDPTYYIRNLYTLLLLDVTDDLALTSDPDTLVHWQMVNIRQGDLTNGNTTLPYKAPLPLTGQGDRTLMFLLLQQSMEVNPSDLVNFTGDSCPQHLLHRCRFHLAAFITQLGMKVEGASWFVTSQDLYSRQQAVLENLQPEASACLGVPDYSSPCLDACNPDISTPECLAAVKQVMADDNRFWFGTDYNIACPPFSFSATCNNNDRNHTSIITRVRVNNDNSTDTIKQVLNVTYDAPAGSYHSCGNTYQVPAVTQTLDPTQSTNISLWSANHLPHVSWTAEDNKIYTLIVWDAGAIILHGVMYNIRGSNLDNAQTAYNYRGPKNPVDRDQPYVFLLYEQQAEIIPANITNALIAFLSENRFLAPDKIVNIASLSGPVGVSVLTVKADPFSTEYMKQNRIVNNCPTALTPMFAALPLSYNVSDVRLLSSVDVTFTSPEISFRSCCHDVIIVSNSRMTNPMGNGRISPVYTRHVPSIALTPLSFFDTFYYMRNHYTLLLLDLTDDLALTDDPDTLVHWQVVNIRQGDLTYGDTTLPYKAPLPLTGDRTLMFLLLQQSMEVNVSDLARFTGDSCPQHVLHRCHFNLTAFITQLRMKVEGASWFVTSPDLYSRQQAVLENLQPEASACLGVPDYSSPCQTAADTCSNGAELTKRVSVMALWLCGLVLALMARV